MLMLVFTSETLWGGSRGQAKVASSPWAYLGPNVLQTQDELFRRESYSIVGEVLIASIFPYVPEWPDLYSRPSLCSI